MSAAPGSVQAKIPFEALTQSGLAWLGGNIYSVTLELSDVNYSLAPSEVQEGVIEKYARFLNSHLAGTHVQIQLINQVLDKEVLARGVALAMRGDGVDDWRSEYNSLIASRLATGRNNCVSRKYVTLTIEAEGVEEAKTTLSRMVTTASAALREIEGCQARQLDGAERLALITYFLRPGAPRFDYAQLLASNLTTKDVVVPLSLDVGRDHVDAGGRLWQLLVLRDFPAFISDQLLAELADLPLDMAVSIHIDPLSQKKGLDLVKAQIAGMDIQRGNEQRRLLKQGLSSDLMPHELQASFEEATELRTQLERSNEKLFRTTIVIAVGADTEGELAGRVERVKTLAAKHSCNLETLRYMQLDGLGATLPLGVCRLPVFRTLTTGALAVMVPFTTAELMEEGGDFYGVNARSKNLIVADRRRGMNANGFVLGTTGSGKSQFAKFSMLQTFLRRPTDELLIIDPDREYVPLASVMGANRVIVSSSSPDSINPLEVDKGAGGESIQEKCGVALSLLEVLLGGEGGLSASERSIIDRCVARLYRDYLNTDGATPPTLTDLYDALSRETDGEGRELARGLELYASGSASGFARATSIDRSNRVTVFDTADLSRDVQTFGMMVVLEEIWGRIKTNRARGIRTWVYVDEFHTLFSNPHAASYFEAMYKRVRKWGASMTGITQNIEELLANKAARLMLSNSDGLFLLNQQATDGAALADLLKLSGEQAAFFTNQAPGKGLLRLGGVLVPFDNTMPASSRLYELFSTKFEDKAA
ncbi:VirB4-like conjugal transfer ATPase, CD1110 family [Actinotignum sp. GS-2025b]|uniref:VirB4-like conjugal transfer ATPase, CD1110 family n=1 Tax=Actinotignum sp. GS-2025b TaxID=3427275 RepID=UPI003F47BDC8